MFIAFAIGECLIAASMYFVKSYNDIEILVAIISFLSCLTIPLLVETPCYFLSVKNYKELENSLKYILCYTKICGIGYDTLEESNDYIEKSKAIKEYIDEIRKNDNEITDPINVELSQYNPGHLRENKDKKTELAIQKSNNNRLNDRDNQSNDFPQNPNSKTKSENDLEYSKIPLFTLFQSKRYLKYTLALIVILSNTYMIYTAAMLLVSSLGFESIYTNGLALGLSELVVYVIIIIFFAEKIERRKTNICMGLCNIIGAVSI